MAKKCSGPTGSNTVAPSYKATPTMGHSSYQARFQIHYTEDYYLNVPQERPTLLYYIRSFFHCRSGVLIRGGLIADLPVSDLILKL